MKCGTSSVYSYLAGHPEICAAIQKEPEFFSEKQGHGVRVDHYQHLWNFDRTIHKYALEASTGYTKYPYEPNVPRNIHRYRLRPKFIYIIRNPFHRIESHFNYMQRRETWPLTIQDKHLLDTSDYFLQLEQYRRYFPRRDILLLDFEELKNSPLQLLEKMYRFLDLSDAYQPPSFAVNNKTRGVSPLERVLIGARLDGLVARLPKSVTRVCRGMALRVCPSSEKRVLTMMEREVIFNRLQSNMLKLKSDYGFDVRKWGFHK
jgi:hypothetical protein